MMNTQLSNDNYRRPNKLLLSILGLWPYQTAIEKILFFLISIFFVITQGILQIGGLITAWENTDTFLESIPPVTIDLVCYIKLINFIYNADKMKNLLELIEDHWKEYGVGQQLIILQNYGASSKRKTLMYAGAVYGSMVPFMLGPLVPLFVEGFFPPSSNKTMEFDATFNSRPLMFHVEYFVDVEKWYYYILIHSYFGTMVYITIVVSIDTMLLTYVQHACSLFAIIGYRLEHLVDSDTLNIEFYADSSNDKSYENIIECIKQHKLALKYVDIIEDANTVSLFLQVGINVLCLSFTGYQAVSKMDHPEESIRYVSFMAAQAFPVFFASYPSQCLITESLKISEYFTQSPWFLTSKKTRKLFNIMVLRCFRPCGLTAANFYVLDLQFFATVVKTSMSYLTMLRSVR